MCDPKKSSHGSIAFAGPLADGLPPTPTFRDSGCGAHRGTLDFGSVGPAQECYELWCVCCPRAFRCGKGHNARNCVLCCQMQLRLLGDPRQHERLCDADHTITELTELVWPNPGMAPDCRLAQHCGQRSLGPAQVAIHKVDMPGDQQRKQRAPEFLFRTSPYKHTSMYIHKHIHLHSP